ncbi:uncharacterized protein FTOL_13247 [Fusarium torulosum]|uniref:Uncharacterized protein n=1 Tax=Fusarium torulosum TaxID=33205 RepID=A0AAE8SPM8_9HYPO|nr:uncharacterized protein FTOL_13247 [Fusarium torulosum]
MFKIQIWLLSTARIGADARYHNTDFAHESKHNISVVDDRKPYRMKQAA